MGEALQYAHQHEKHIVHRDLKPENILFNASGDALLADFGIAAILATTGTKVLEKSGTPYYMAPEQFEGKVSTRSDQYALGCIAYELLAGRKPYNLDGANAIVVQYQHARVEPDPPTRYNPRIPAHIERAIRKAMSKDRANRYSDVAAFFAALAARTQPAKTEKQWLDEGDAHLNAGHYKEALVADEQAIRLNPNSTNAYIARGDALNELERYDEALIADEQAIRLNPNSANAHIGKGYVLDELKQYEEARAAYEQAIRLDPYIAMAHRNKGGILYQLGRKEESQKAYDIARQLGYEG